MTVGRDQGHPVVASGVTAVAAGAWRSMRGGDIDARIEIDLRLRRVAEVGMTLDASGPAFGMAVRGPRRTLAIPTATIDRVAAKLATHGRIARGYLGLALQPVRVGEGVGAMVMAVESGGPGAAANVQQGDVIVAWNGKPIEGVRALTLPSVPRASAHRGTVDPARGQPIDRPPDDPGATRSLTNRRPRVRLPSPSMSATRTSRNSCERCLPMFRA